MLNGPVLGQWLRVLVAGALLACAGMLKGCLDAQREELELVARHCRERGVVAITDEIYEHILYDGCEHVSLASLPGMEELTVTINALSKTYSVTGWRVGWAIACLIADFVIS